VKHTGFELGFEHMITFARGLENTYRGRDPILEIFRQGNMGSAGCGESL
jgi:hypothetical protein